MFQPIYNQFKVNNFLRNIYLQIDERDIHEKTAYKKIKRDLKQIINVRTLWLLSKKINKEKEFIKSFFPTRFEEINSNGEFITYEFYYRTSEDKVVWVVHQNDNERTFKLHTDSYNEKISTILPKVLLSIKNELDKLYGYFIEIKDNGSWLVTDKNMCDGKYRAIVYGNDRHQINYFIENSFCSRDEILDIL